MATLYTLTETKAIKPANGTNFTLEEMQGLVGGYIEPIRLSAVETMYVDEDGRSKKLDNNYAATERLRQAYGDNTVVVLGNAVVCYNREFR